jgi:hypothetical protein
MIANGASLMIGAFVTLIAIARARGLRRMEGFVLAENTGMRGLAGRLGFADTQCPNDRMLRLVSLDPDSGAARPGLLNNTNEDGNERHDHCR